MSDTGEKQQQQQLPEDLSQLPEEELLAWDKERLVRSLRKAEAERIGALVQRGRLIQEVNRQLQGHLREIRELKAVNGLLQEQNEELRDLCCFLDEDRLKVKGLAGEWQSLGRRAARVMRDDLGGYLRKLANLERLQEALVRENLELRQHCAAHRRQHRHGGGGGVEEEEEEEEEDCAALRDTSPAGLSDLNIPCGPRDLGDGSSSTGSVGSPDQTHLICSPED